MSRTRRFISGISFGYASQVLTTLVGLWLTPFLLFRIGQHDYGLWLVGTQIMFYLGLLDVGVVALLPRETAFATGRARSIEEASDLPLIVGQTARVVLWQTPLVALAAIIAWFLIPVEWEGLRNPIGMVLVAFVLTFPLRIFGALLHGLQDLAFLGRIGIISYVISTAVTVALILLGWGLFSLAIGWAVLQLISAITSWYRLRRHFPTVLPGALPRIVWPAMRGRLKRGFWVSANQIAQVLLSGTDILIIGKLFGPAAIVPLVCTGKLIGVLANQPLMLMQAAGPALSQIRTAESRGRLSQVCTALSQAMLMLSGAVVCVVIAVNHSFVLRWVGAEQYGGAALTVLIVLSMLLRHWNITLAYALFSSSYEKSYEKRLCLTALLDGLVTVTGIGIFAWYFGRIGAPIGSIIGVCVVSLPLNLLALAKESGTSIVAQLRPLFPWFVRFIVVAIGASILPRFWLPTTLLSLGVTAIAIGTIYAAVMFPLTLRLPLGLYVRPRLFSVSRFFRALRATGHA